MALNRMSGSPWHVEKMQRKEGDSRRHRSKCAFYKDASFCTKKNGKCIGSAHCFEYKEKDHPETKSAKNNDDDFYWL